MSTGEPVIASTVTEAAHLMGRSRSSLYNWRARGADGFSPNGTVDLLALRRWLNGNGLGVDTSARPSDEPDDSLGHDLAMIEFFGCRLRFRLERAGYAEAAKEFLDDWERRGVRQLVEDMWDRLEALGLSEPRED